MLSGCDRVTAVLNLRLNPGVNVHAPQQEPSANLEVKRGGLQ